MEGIRFALAVVLTVAAGLGIVTRFGKQPRSGPGLVGLGFFVGALAVALWVQVLLWVRIPVTPWTVLLGAAAMPAMGRWRALREAVWKRPPWPAFLLIPAALFLIGGALSTTHLGYDPETMYLLRAKSIAHHGTFWNEDFTDPDRVHLAHRRPLLLPILYANVSFATGSWDGRLIRLWFALLQIAGWAAMYDVLRGKTGRMSAAAATSLWAVVPALWHDHGGAVVPYADAPLGMAILFALGAEGPIAGILLSGGALLKDEGAAFLLPFALFRSWKVAAVPAVVALAWHLTALRLPLDRDFLPAGFLNLHVTQLPFILRKLLGEVLLWKHWSLLWVLILGVLAVRLRHFDRHEWRRVAPLGLQVAIYVGIWMTFPPELLQTYIRVQDMRLLLHVAPAFWVWAAGRPSTPPQAIPVQEARPFV